MGCLCRPVPSPLPSLHEGPPGHTHTHVDIPSHVSKLCPTFCPQPHLPCSSGLLGPREEPGCPCFRVSPECLRPAGFVYLCVCDSNHLWLKACGAADPAWEAAPPSACRQPEAARARAALPPQSSRGRQRSAEKRRRINVGRLWAEGGLGPGEPRLSRF